MRVSPRLLVAVVAPAIVSLAIGLPLLWASLTGVAERTAAEDLDAALSILVPLVETELSRSPEGLQDWVRANVRDPALRLTVITEGGAVLADSQRTRAELLAMDNHKSRPEVVAAREAGRGSALRSSATLRTDFVYVARAVSQGDGGLTVVRLARPLSALAGVRRQIARLLWTVLLVSLLTLAVVALWLGRRLFRPLEELANAADRLARGDLAHRVEISGEDSLRRVGGSLNQLACRVEEQVRAVEAQRGRLEVVGASMSEGILVTDDEGRALLVNPSFRKIFRVQGEVEGRSPAELALVPEIADMIEATLATGETRTVALELKRPRRRSVAVTSSLLRDASGVVVAANDISDLVHIGEVRRDLVANVSHELRTPLTAIRGYAETLKDGAAEEPELRDRFVGRIVQQCQRLQALLDDLLTLSKLESSNDAVEFEAIDLDEVLREAAEVLGAAAREKEVELALGLEGNLAIEGNRQALEELCLNLLENAIKYNRRGGEVSVRVRQEEDDIVLRVEDTGRGIPDQALPRLFERFYRVDRGRSREEGGTGLGLAIVKHAIKIHEGDIDVESELGKGSTFTVRLPRCRRAAASLEPEIELIQ